MPGVGTASAMPTVPTHATPPAASSSARQTSSKDLGKNDFLLLLIAQLRNQDPLKPMEDREFIAQLAQFRTLEQMEKMTTTLDRLMQTQQITLAGSLVGRTIKTTNGLNGAVSSVSIKDGTPTLQVGAESVALDAVTEVR